MADDDWGSAAAATLEQINIGGDGLEGNSGPLGRGSGRGMGRGMSVIKPGPQHGPSGDSTDEDKVLNAGDASILNKLLHQKLVTTKADLEIQHKDPKSPLYSVKSFEALHLNLSLLKGMYDMGFSFPSKIQESALPALLADPPSNMIAQSQSGTGKTAAFVCCMLSRVNPSLKHPQCMVLAPTFELALQTGEVINKMAKYMEGVKTRFAVRGEKVTRGQTIGEQIVVGTPGTILDWCLKFRVIDMKKINVFVLDEADVMISMQGHQDQSVRLQRTLRPDCQMLLFSATYTADVMKFAESIIAHPIVIRLRREEESLDNIKQYFIRCNSNEEKFEALTNIYGTISIGQSMIFCRTRKTAEWLCAAMTREGNAVALLSGDLDVTQRQSVIERFRDGKEKVLITTNVSARGLDIEQVTVVVNFDLPTNKENTEPDFETYLHRIGRTGRFGKSGLAINFVDGSRTLHMMKEIENHFQKRIDPLNAQDVDEIEKIKQ